MSTHPQLLRFVHITDTHISHDPHYNQTGAPHTPMVGARALVQHLSHLTFAPDFVLHTGDVAFDPVPEAYQVAREILSEIPYPVYYLAGNHDDPATLQRVLVDAEPRDPFDYAVDINGFRLICIDSNRPARQPRGRMSAAQLDWLRDQCDSTDADLIIATHHNPLQIGIPWWDDYMSLENGDAFHAALLPFRDRIRGVFFGHVHQNTDLYRDGILYASTLSSWYQLTAMPGQIQTETDRISGPGYSVVTVTATTTFIRRHRFVVAG